MRTPQNVKLAMILSLIVVWPAAAQMGMRQPQFRGVWNPEVGSGAAYQVSGKSGKSEIELTIVGKEDVNGKPGYWMEMGLNRPNGGGQMMYVKNLILIDGKDTTIARMIVQPPGSGPMEMPTMMVNRRAQETGTTDIREQAEHVGTESVTTPAGSFSCEHHRSKDQKWDVWLSPKVSPWGLVKSNSDGQEMVLVRVISDAKDHITGTPQKFDPAEMMRQRMGQPPR